MQRARLHCLHRVHDGDRTSRGRSLREVAREAGVSEEILDQALDYRAMAKPHPPTDQT